MASGTGWRANVALMRRGTESRWQGSGWPTRGVNGAEGADTWQEATRTTRVHKGARVGRHVAGEAGRWRAHGLGEAGRWRTRVHAILITTRARNRI